jgi:hypothetical protein
MRPKREWLGICGYLGDLRLKQFGIELQIGRMSLSLGTQLAEISHQPVIRAVRASSDSDIPLIRGLNCVF